MRKSAFATIRTAPVLTEAEALVGVLRRAGMHPVDLSLSVPFSLLVLPRSHFLSKSRPKRPMPVREFLDACHDLS